MKDRIVVNNDRDIRPFRLECIEQTKILLAESEIDLLLLFKIYLEYKGLKLIAVNLGEMALRYFKREKDRGRCFKIIVLNTHLIDYSGLDIAEKIRMEKPSQRIVMVTKQSKEHLPKDKIKSIGLEKNDILDMPFKLSYF